MHVDKPERTGKNTENSNPWLIWTHSCGTNEFQLTRNYDTCFVDCQIDAALAIDVSGSIAVNSVAKHANWIEVSNFLVSLVNSFEIGPNRVKFGAVTFADA